jgi:hypothetical protein
MSYIVILKSFTAISPSIGYAVTYRSIFFPEVISSTLVLRKQRIRYTTEVQNAA